MAAKVASPILDTDEFFDFIDNYGEDHHLEFMRKYSHDPYGFVRECVNFRGLSHDKPTAYQKEILELFIKRKRVCVRSPRGAGKSALVSWVVWWALLTAPDVKVFTTAPSWRQLKKYLWPEIHKWSARIDFEKVGIEVPNRTQLMSTEITLPYGTNSKARLAFAISPETPELIEGAHSPRMVGIFDEAKLIPDDVFDAAEGGFSEAEISDLHEAYALIVSTPGVASGRFFNIHTKRDIFSHWTARHVTKHEVVAAGKMSEQWIEDMRRQWGEESSKFLNHVEAEFSTQNATSNIIIDPWIERSNELWTEKDRSRLEITAIGVDVGGTAAKQDDSVIAFASGMCILEIKPYKADEMRLASIISQFLTKNPHCIAVIDVIGKGSGVYTRLKQIAREGNTNWSPRNVRPFNAGGKPPIYLRDRTDVFNFADNRSASWWLFREALDDIGYEESGLLLPPNERLQKELTTPRLDDTVINKLKVESKRHMRKRLRKRIKSTSTDYADACIMATTVLSLLPKRRATVYRIGHGRVES